MKKKMKKEMKKMENEDKMDSIGVGQEDEIEVWASVKKKIVWVWALVKRMKKKTIALRVVVETVEQTLSKIATAAAATYLNQFNHPSCVTLGEGKYSCLSISRSDFSLPSQHVPSMSKSSGAQGKAK
ncbi:hypothetical protein FNV43_RR16956 [Rhamnella rubrinervis]|uniref:Uncharacterized protein n=1 Tax=Rhamnella rubrinervis TaxID=2594499 RepID=A0A8K0GZS9_9ROSA|nr:hypothetical protein FNV43_RR16956 [Rhamnella rubrinervis]